MIMLTTFLRAAGLEDLDLPSNTTNSTGHVESYRYAGAVLIVYITYSNTFNWFSLSDVEYEYSAILMVCVC